MLREKAVYVNYVPKQKEREKDPESTVKSLGFSLSLVCRKHFGKSHYEEYGQGSGRPLLTGALLHRLKHDEKE